MQSITLRGATGVLALSLTPAVSFGQFTPTLELTYAQPDHQYDGPGFAAADYDSDGDIDVFLPTEAGTDDILLVNRGDGTFTQTTLPLIGGQDRSVLAWRSKTALWLDYNGDRLLDLLVFGDCDTFSGTLPSADCTNARTPRLYRQYPGGQFADVADATGLVAAVAASFTPNTVGGIAAGDLNGDGYPDLFVGRFPGGTGVMQPGLARVLLTTHDPLTNSVSYDLAAQSVIGNPRQWSWLCHPVCCSSSSLSCDPDYNGGHWASILHDFDGDGALDIYSAIDGEPNTLWLGPVTAASTALENHATLVGMEHGIPLSLSSPLCEDSECDGGTGISSGNDAGGTDMGIAIGDYDNDGVFDFYLTNTNIETEQVRDALLRWSGSYQSSSGMPVRENAIDGSGIGIGPESGQDESWGWGTTFFDADLDGWEDLAVTNGALADLGTSNDHSRLYINTVSHAGLPDFADASQAWGFYDTFGGKALGAMDLDRSGTLDLVQTVEDGPGSLRVLSNDYAGPNDQWLVVRPRMIGPDAFAVGAVVKVEAVASGGGELHMQRLISAGESFMTQEPYEAHFGFGAADLAVAIVTIEWPGDTYEDTKFSVTGSTIDRVVTVGWCNQVDLVAPFGQLDGDDWDEVMARINAQDLRADFTADGVVDYSDKIVAQHLYSQGCATDTIPIDFVER